MLHPDCKQYALNPADQIHINYGRLYNLASVDTGLPKAVHFEFDLQEVR